VAPAFLSSIGPTLYDVIRCSKTHRPRRNQVQPTFKLATLTSGQWPVLGLGVGRVTYVLGVGLDITVNLSVAIVLLEKPNLCRRNFCSHWGLPSVHSAVYTFL